MAAGRLTGAGHKLSHVTEKLLVVEEKDCELQVGYSQSWGPMSTKLFRQNKSWHQS